MGELRDRKVPKFLSFKRSEPITKSHLKNKERERRRPRQHHHEKIKKLNIEDQVRALKDVKVDVKGDIDIPQYGLRLRYSTPKYRRESSFVYGYSHLYTIVSHRSSKVVLLAVKDANNLPDKDITQKLSNGHSGYVKINRNQSESVSDFLLFSPSNQNSSSEADNVDISSNVLFLNDYLKKELVEGNKLVESHPELASSWLKVSSIQEKLAHTMSQNANDTLRGKKLAYGIRQVKINVLERALQCDELIADERETIIIEYMKIAQEEYDTDALNTKWKAFINEYPSSSGLWIEYINQQLTQFHSFSVDHSLEIFRSCIDALSKALVNAAVEERLPLEETMSYIILRLCIFLKESGYSEMALACMQLQMELCYFFPDTLDPQNTSSVFKSLSAFWHSQVPKLGEVNAVSWDSWCDNHSGTPLRSALDEYDIMEKEHDLDKWVNREAAFSKQFLRPRILDPIVFSKDGDPYRAVLFKDIRPYLCIFKQKEVIASFKYNFLVFLGLHSAIPAGVSTNSSYFSDIFIQGYDFSILSEQNRCSTTFHRFCIPSFLENFVVPFPNWPVVPLLNLTHCEESRLTFIYEVLRAITSKCLDSQLAGYYLIFLFQHKNDLFLSESKLLLRKYPNDLELWFLFGTLAQSLGNPDLAGKIFRTLQGRTVANGFEKWHLYSLLCPFYIFSNSLDIGSKLISDLIDNEKIDIFNEGNTLRYMQSSDNAKLFYYRAKILLLWCYMKNSQGFMSLLKSIMYQFTYTWTDDDAYHEQLHMFGLKLVVYFTSNTRVYKQKDLCHVVSEGISKYPNNALFMHYLTFAQASTSFEQTWRFLFLKINELQNAHSIVLTMYTAWLLNVYSKNKIRCYRFLKNILQNANYKSSTALWKMLLQMVTKYEALNLAHESVIACPWSKDIALCAIQNALKQTTNVDLLYFNCLAKGLRFHYLLQSTD
ncbi:DuF1740 family protein [Schizosaccharomyces japonicus yFS275]|uniref:DuF1740 family protein n=1 Tax=Schizosaccharomyces japonicus (strain yFS275 / FY16936) TaxID=402676 RepID=B6K0D8_SCHJY|nr:DuF1740 family protein [Schizosaccharomyces japonicus yFS275]EEB06288.1 DuF1740 family protein [Schizosaccharomyces japonicus yFS275]